MTWKNFLFFVAAGLTVALLNRWLTRDRAARIDVERVAQEARSIEDQLASERPPGGAL